MHGSDAAYEQLRWRVKTGTLALVNTGGIPRGLTSILTKVLGEGRIGPGKPVALFDRIVHEPFLQIPNRDAPGGVYGKLLEEVEGIEREAAAMGRNLWRYPATILVKNNSYHLTGEEWDAFLPLLKCAIVSVRNPALTFLSLARAMARIAMANFPEDRTMTRCMAQALEQDDFSTHGSEYARHFGFHSLIGHPDVQRKLWDDWAKTFGMEAADRFAQEQGFRDWRALTLKFAGTSAHAIHTLPKLLRGPLEFHRVGWPSLEGLVNRLRRTETKYVVIDSTDLQLDPGYFLPWLGKFVRTSIGATGGPRFTPKFHAGSAGTTSGMLYERVSQTNAIEPPHQSPVPAERLPILYRRQLENAYTVYFSLLRDGRRLRPHHQSPAPISSTSEKHYNIATRVDPTFSYCSVSLEDDHPARNIILARINRVHTNLGAYFRVIDKVCLRAQSKVASSAESVGAFWLGEVAEIV